MTTAEVRIEQEELDAIKRSVLTSSRRLLVDSLDPASHLSYLRSKFIFTERDAEEINAPASRSARVEVFLDKLGLKGSKAYDEFENSLCRDRTQVFLLTGMTKKLELLKHKVREFKVQQLRQQQELQRQQQELLRAQQKMQPPSHSFYQQHSSPPPTFNHQPHQQKSSYSPPVSSGSPRSPHQQRPAPCGGFSMAGQQQRQPQQGLNYQPTPAQQAQRDAYCQQRLVEMGHSHQRQPHAHTPAQQPTYQSQQSMGFSPPPRYSHTFSLPQTPPPHPNHHRHVSPRQTPPNFQSRGIADDANPGPPVMNHENHNHLRYYPEGFPPGDITSPPDIPSGQPCGQPS